MSTLKNKIDFAVVFSVSNANPNGDPLNGNRPRETTDGLGEVSDVCIKRKIRNRLQDMGESIFVQMEERSDDGCDSLSRRAEANAELKAAAKDSMPKRPASSGLMYAPSVRCSPLSPARTKRPAYPLASEAP